MKYLDIASKIIKVNTRQILKRKQLRINQVSEEMKQILLNLLKIKKRKRLNKEASKQRFKKKKKLS